MCTRYLVQRFVQLRAAIAFQASQHVTGQAFAVQAHHWNALVALAYHQSNMVTGVCVAAEGDNLCIGICCDWQPRPRRDLQAGAIIESGNIGRCDNINVIGANIMHQKRGQQTRKSC